MRKKAVKASRRYLELMGWKHLGTSNDFEVYEDNDGYYTFVNTTWSTNEFKESDKNTLQSEAEYAMTQWFSDHEELCDIPIRIDEVQLHVLSNSRALIRHKVNAICC